MTARRLMLAAGAALVALSSACKRDKEPPTAASSPMADSADQVMFGARAILTDKGLMRAELFGDTAYFFDDNTRVEMRTVKTNFFTTEGAQSAVLTSKEGTYRTQGNMEARGDVVVVSTDGRRLTTPQLRFDQVRNEISSDSAFVLTEPGRRVAGVGFVSDPNMNNVRILKTTSGSTGRVTIPGQ
ncbi:MAG TPA: LPS export ABC transporter periplasmic protein LptC [Gemmatimonadaceae bacterium]|nr:LPS export ABC transporter periplasmic protein LptC [Gemmatimonadaceae bacterium]